MASGPRRPFTEAEDCYLRQANAAGLREHEIAQELGRTASSVASRMNKLRLVRVKPVAAPPTVPVLPREREINPADDARFCRAMRAAIEAGTEHAPVGVVTASAEARVIPFRIVATSPGIRSNADFDG